MKLLELRSNILSFVKLANHESIVASMKFTRPKRILVMFVSFPRPERKLSEVCNFEIQNVNNSPKLSGIDSTKFKYERSNI
jgi:hypothetical protein